MTLKTLTDAESNELDPKAYLAEIVKAAQAVQAFVTALNGNSAAVAATGSISLTDNPADTETITISDGTTSVVFEFDTDAEATITPGNIRVVVGATAAATMVNLIAAINANAFGVTAAPTVPASAGCTLVNDTAGTTGNVAITDTTDATVVGMTGGLNTVTLRTIQTSLDAI